MIRLGPNKLMVETPEELPRYESVDELFLDVETTHFGRHPKDKATNAWRGDRICGVAVTADDDPTSYYIPVRHRNSANVEPEPYHRWLASVVSSCRDWVNHNVIFDAVFCGHDGAMFSGRLVDTLTLAKIHDSDRLGHGLKDICREWLGLKMEEETRLKAYLEGIGSKDYGDAPSDMLGDYACQDVLGNRDLYRYLVKHRPTEQDNLWQTEIDLTPVLFDAEWDGLRIDPQQVKMEYAKRLRKLITAAEELEKLGGREFTNSSVCIHDILVNQYSLPVLKRQDDDDEDSNASFDKKALALYEVHPQVVGDDNLSRLVGLIREYREHSYLCGHFKSWLELADDHSHIHPSYNQVVRTGRMSCRNPNIQGINKFERHLILPEEGQGFISCDYSQIEFRLIVHYINDADAIRAYNEDPDTDFHQWVADLIRIKRKPAKRLNFGMGYGAGKKKVTSELAAEPDIIAEIGGKVNEMIMAGDLDPLERNKVFASLCARRAAEVYNQYHEALPGIQRTAREAQSVCKRRGYVFNAYGRRRHLPPKVARKAFNAIVQGCAMDIMKERMVALSPRYNERSRELGLRLRLNVHDEVTFSAPVEVTHDPEVQDWVVDTLQTPSVPFSIPIRCGLGISSQNWMGASDETRFALPDGRYEGCLIGWKKEESRQLLTA